MVSQTTDDQERRVKSVSWGTCSYIKFSQETVEPVQKPIPNETQAEQIQKYFEGENLSGLQITPRKRNVQYESVEELFATEFGEGPLMDKIPVPAVPALLYSETDCEFQPDYKMRLSERVVPPPCRQRKKEKAAANNQIRKGLGAPRRELLSRIQKTFGQEIAGQTYLATGRKLSPLNLKSTFGANKGSAFKTQKSTATQTRASQATSNPSMERKKTRPRVLLGGVHPHKKDNPLQLLVREGVVQDSHPPVSKQILLFEQGLLVTFYIREEGGELLSVEIYSGSDSSSPRLADDLASACRQLLGTVVSPDGSRQGLEQVHLRLRRMLPQKINLLN